MQDEPSRGDADAQLDSIERVVLSLLLDSSFSGPWSVDELGREIGSELHAAAAIVSLHASGLVHRCHEFVLVTRSATRFNQLVNGA